MFMVKWIVVERQAEELVLGSGARQAAWVRDGAGLSRRGGVCYVGRVGPPLFGRLKVALRCSKPFGPFWVSPSG